MTGWDRPAAQPCDAEAILAELSTRQYLYPHRPLAEVIESARQKLGFCPLAAAAAIDWLALEPHRLIGRLRRAELIQLARSIHRLSRQAYSPQT